MAGVDVGGVRLLMPRAYNELRGLCIFDRAAQVAGATAVRRVAADAAGVTTIQLDVRHAIVALEGRLVVVQLLRGLVVLGAVGGCLGLVGHASMLPEDSSFIV